jgi:preprotein translocase subunit Sec63
MGINDKSPYEILGVGRYSTQKEIRKRYLELCKIYHPDVSKLKDTTARFKDIKYAYEVLTHKTIPKQPLIRHYPPSTATTTIDTHLWTRRSILGGFGLMAVVIFYLSMDRQEESYSKIESVATHKSPTPWKEAGMSFRDWRQK